MLLVLFYYVIFCSIARDSDNAGNFLAGVDWFSGNPHLKNWVLPPDNFLNSDLLLYGLLSKIFGVRIEVCYYSAALIWAGVVLLAVGLAHQVAKSPYAALGIFTVLGLPVIQGNQELELVSFSPYHIGSVLYLLAACSFAHHYLRRGGNLGLLGYFGLLSLDCFGDPMMIYLGVLPISVALIYQLLLLGRRDRRLSSLAAVTLLAAVFGKLLLLWIKSDGFHSPPLPIAFAPFADFRKNLNIVTRGVFIFAGADFWGHQIQIADVVNVLILLIHLPLLFFQIRVILKATVVHSQSFFKAIENNIFTQTDPDQALMTIAYFITIFNLAAGLFSSSVQELQHIRYLIPGFIFGNVLVAVRASRLATYRIYIKICFTTTLFYTVLVYHPFLISGPVGAAPELWRTESKLREMEIFDGFGFYWDATLINVLSQQRLRTRPLILDGEHHLHSYTWTSSAEWFRTDSFKQIQFYVITRQKGRPGFISRDQAISYFGPAQQEILIPPITLLIYNTSEKEAQLRIFRQEAVATYDRFK